MELMRGLAKYLAHTRRKWNVLMLAIAVMLGMALCCTHTQAQSGAGSIQGTVTDSTGAVIPGAAVHVVNQDTNVAADTKSNGAGYYQVPDLFTGTYVVSISAPGMKFFKATVELQAAQAAVINPTLSAGAVTQEVEVQADVVQLTTTDNGTISSTLENNRINQLPMNGRLIFTLAGMTTPGLEGGGTRPNGLMGQGLEYVADGAPMDNRNFGNPEQNINQAALPDPDAVQEVHLEMTGESAQFAAPATAIMTTKSGSNSLHGSFFETARNNAFGVAKRRQDPSNFSAPHLVRNEFGASAGGPIILPKVYNGKDKSFWFFAYERYSNVATTNEPVTVPTNAMRSGDFSGLTNGSGVLQQLYDSSTTYNSGSANCPGTATSPTNPNGSNAYCRTAFTNNQIPINRLAPSTKILYDITPTPTSADNPLVHANFTAPNPNFTVVPTVTLRLDHSFTENNKAYLRYTQNIQTQSSLQNYPANAPQTIAADGFPAGADGLGDIPAATFSSALGFTHVFSPTFFSETILSQQWQAQNNEGGGNPNLNYEQMLGLPNNFGQPGFPYIGASTSTFLLMGMRGTQWNYSINQIISNLDENLTKTLGRHQLQFGGRYRHERFACLPDRSTDNVLFGSYASALENPASGTSYTAAPNTGYPDADYFLGAAYTYTINLQAPHGHFHDMEGDAYFQDNYHLSRNLTANIGLRYEAHPAAWTKYGLMEGTDLKNHALVLANPLSYYIAGGYTTQAIVTNLQNIGVVFETPADAGFPTTIMPNYDLTIDPRIGIAYQPFGGKYGTVIRGGYGRFAYPVPVRGSFKNGVKSPPMVSSYTQSYTSASQSPDGKTNYLLRTPQTVVAGRNSSGVVNSGSINSILPGIAPYSIDPSSYPPTFATQVNFTIEQPLKGNSALRLSWLWTHGTNLDQYYYPNNHPSTYAWQMLTGTALPTGSVIGSNQYAATAAGPWDQTVYGNNAMSTKMGFSNDYALEVNYQRLFHRGIAYQVTYVQSVPLRAGGNFSNDSLYYPAQNYVGNTGELGTMTSPYGTVISPVLPPVRPVGIAPYMGWRALDKYENYGTDTAIPKEHIQFNGIVDLPFGRGKRFLGNSNRLLNELVGGFQLAGDGNIISQNFQVSNAYWGATNPLTVYKHKAPITDCRSGVCHASFEWFNGYLAPTVVNATTKGVSGLPSNYVPFQTPIDNAPGTAYYGQNEVQVTLLNGTTSAQTYSPGPTGTNPFYKTFLNGPINYAVDLSLFKTFPITERVDLRFNVDAFNALNVQGYLNPSSADGTESLLSSYNTPRQVQFTLRLTF